MSSHTQRTRGAQPGNSNALRHGLYSRNFTEAENSSLDKDVQGEFTDEIALARIQVGRLSEMLLDYKNMPFENYIAASNALNNYLDRIQRLSRIGPGRIRVDTNYGSRDKDDAAVRRR